MIKTAAQIMAEIGQEHPDRRVVRRVGRPRQFPEICTHPSGCAKKSRARGRCTKHDEEQGIVPPPCQDPRCARAREHTIHREKRTTWHRNLPRYENTDRILVWRDNEDPRPLVKLKPKRGYAELGSNMRLLTAAMIWLVKERHRQRLSAAELGRRIELSQSRTSEIEQLRDLNVTVVQRYARALGYVFELDGRLVRRDKV